MSERDQAEGGVLDGSAWQAQQSREAWRETVGEWLYGKVRLGERSIGDEAGRRGRADTTSKRLAERSNEEILDDLKSFVGAERQSLAKVIVYLVEVEERRIHLALACSSMFDFCTRTLGFSEGEAFRRLTAARLVRRFPVLLNAIASGRIHLSSLVLLRDHLTETNVDEVVAAASGKAKREVEELVARMAPKPDVQASIRKLPERRPSSSAASSPEAFTTASPGPTSRCAPPARLQPIAEGRYKVQLTASEVLRDKLELARALMSHQNPTGDLAVIVERAVELLIGKLSKEKLGKGSRARRRKSPAKHGYVTNAARREVFEHDGLQCSFVGENGERCQARSFLEIDHIIARALGGSGEAENLRVLCRAHNRDAAERVFGRAHVEARIRSSRKRSTRTIDRTAPSAGAPDFSQRKSDAHVEARIRTAASAGAPDFSQRKSDAHVEARIRTAASAGAPDFSQRKSDAHVEARIRSSRKRSTRTLERTAPSAGAPDFSQRKSDEAEGVRGTEEARVATSTVSLSAIDGVALEARDVVHERTQDGDPRMLLRAALLALGFRRAEADRALLVLDRGEGDERQESWRRPIETLVREAIGILT